MQSIAHIIMGIIAGSFSLNVRKCRLHVTIHHYQNNEFCINIYPRKKYTGVILYSCSEVELSKNFNALVQFKDTPAPIMYISTNYISLLIPNAL